ncbi:MAG: hypothetical protein J6K97_00345 [Clostridia bacterium]|nr:hypothetical protein [Clostridia bacterium]
MNILNNTTDCQMFLKQGNLTKPFLTDEYVLCKVMQDYDSKVKRGRKITKIESLYNWINSHTVFEREDREFVRNNKFQRTAQEIWENKKMTGCTDYATLFAVFARQIKIPTTILHTVASSWIEKLQNGEDFQKHYGHTFLRMLL